MISKKAWNGFDGFYRVIYTYPSCECCVGDFLESKWFIQLPVPLRRDGLILWLECADDAPLGPKSIHTTPLTHNRFAGHIDCIFPVFPLVIHLLVHHSQTQSESEIPFKETRGL